MWMRKGKDGGKGKCRIKDIRDRYFRAGVHTLLSCGEVNSKQSGWFFQVSVTLVKSKMY